MTKIYESIESEIIEMINELKSRLIELGRKAPINSKERLEQALLAVIEYEERKKADEQDIPLIDECVAIINEMNGVNKEREINRSAEMTKRFTELVRSGEMKHLSREEAKKLIIPPQDAYERKPNEEYTMALLLALNSETSRSEPTKGELYKNVCMETDTEAANEFRFPVTADNHKYHANSDDRQRRKKFWQIRRKNRQFPTALRKISKPAAAIVMCAGILFAIHMVSLAYNQNFFGSVFDYTQEMLMSLFGGETSEGEDAAMFSGSREYGSIEEFEAAEGMEISVPKHMPEGMAVQSVIINWVKEGEPKIRVIYTQRVTLYIFPQQNLLPNDIEEVADLYVSNEAEHYIYTDIMQADWISNGDTYRLKGEFTIDEFEEIINSLY